MRVRIERFVECGTRRRVHRHSSPRAHERRIVLWRGDEWRTFDIFDGRDGGPARSTVVLRIDTPCPYDDWSGHLRECMNIGGDA